MRYEILFSPEAIEDFKRLNARDRAILRDGIDKHLRYSPDKTSRSSIKRLRGISRPQFRFRIGDFRVFYDVSQHTVDILAIVPKKNASEWLEAYGEIK